MFNNIAVIIISSGAFSGLFTLIMKGYITRKINHSFDKDIELYKDKIGRDLEQYRTELKLIEAKDFSKWEIKRDACLEALNVADAIISQRVWKGIQENGRSRSRVSTTKARKAYNQLACSCEDPKTLEIFRKIMSSEDSNLSVDIIVDFRNTIRKELEFKENVDSDRITAFIFKGPWHDSL